MSADLSSYYDVSFLWTLFLLTTRSTGILFALPGVGTSQIPALVRMSVAILIGLAATTSGVKAPQPEHLIDGGLMVISEFTLGYLLATIPAMIVSSLAITGQVVSGTIGLGFANLIDPSIGQSLAILARIESLVATLVFLLVDGHHVIIRAVTGYGGNLPIGSFYPGMETGLFFLERFSAVFEVAIICSAPILVSILVTQFVLGLITKSVPQVNIFIISLPLTIGMGLYITAYTFPGMIENLLGEFDQMEEYVGQLFLTTQHIAP
ncbi:MAG: flagellar biosynthetic protein FliR [Bdellovibrionales bacterium]|nr:flagellar biosynthetic protein FliR [Bdellovibrionales bacterium]